MMQAFLEENRSAEKTSSPRLADPLPGLAASIPFTVHGLPPGSPAAKHLTPMHYPVTPGAAVEGELTAVTPVRRREHRTRRQAGVVRSIETCPKEARGGVSGEDAGLDRGILPGSGWRWPRPPCSRSCRRACSWRPSGCLCCKLRRRAPRSCRTACTRKPTPCRCCQWRRRTRAELPDSVQLVTVSCPAVRSWCRSQSRRWRCRP